MTTRNFAVSFPADLHARANQAARADGLSLSGWLAQAAEHELQESAHIADGLAAITEIEAEHGAIAPALMTAPGRLRCSPVPPASTGSLADPR